MPCGDWPKHYVDTVHEEDGGLDPMHRRPQDGISALSELIAGLDMRCGIIPTAWYDANDNAPLRPDLVGAARAVEMMCFSKSHQLT